ncbi:MAG: N-acetylmuramoyl-L-alanine amidase [Bacteroidetes bacterium]|nr:MAG: N-acetylmuramoyl-L-alanine amidase [Bacteroidota bacterium]
MNKLFKLLFVAVIFFFCQITTAQNKNDQVNVIIIDAGHGGKDPGASGTKSKEKNITLAIALKLGKYIEKNLPDVKVIYTRKTDKFIELHERSEIANRNNADLFISIHVNASTKKTITGTSTFIMGLNRAEKQLNVVKRENSVILIEDNYQTKYEGFDPNSPESDIIFSLYQNAYLEKSISLAELVQEEFKDKAKRSDRDVRQAGLVVLWNCSMPSILIETGFITNPTEENFLNTENGQAIIASAIYRAVKKYKYETEHQNEPINTNNDITFKVQLLFSRKKIDTNPENFKGIKNVECIEDGRYYRYFTGHTKSYNEIAKLQKEVRKKIPEAYVIAVNNGKLITVKEALQIINN